MPFTPYHFGPSGFFGLLFRRWIDPFVFVLVNVVIDLEVGAVMYGLVKGSAHRVLHFHTLLLGGAIGVAFGLLVYGIKPVRKLLCVIMEYLHVSYKPTAVKAAVGGLLGAWFHVLIDSCYHSDVQMFWPSRNWRLNGGLYRWLTRGNMELSQSRIQLICMGFFILAIFVYVLAVRRYLKDKNHKVKLPGSEDLK